MRSGMGIGGSSRLRRGVVTGGKAGQEKGRSPGASPPGEVEEGVVMYWCDHEKEGRIPGEIHCENNGKRGVRFVQVGCCCK